mmetsp:Transcript_9114/g.22907  ORF Transcript_9114/g.22907 Transcript_9114/m.22907 type:complete len:220 (+) Transcript_9114:1475-2134(+)
MLLHRSVVSRLLHCETTPVHTIIDSRIDPGIHLLNLCRQVLRLQVQVRITSKFIEFSIQHSHNLGTLIRHNLLQLLVKQNWHCELGTLISPGRAIAGVSVLVELIKERETMGLHRNTGVEIPPSVGTVIPGCIAEVLQLPSGDGHCDTIFQALESTDNKGAVCPRTRPRDIQPISTTLGGVHCCCVGLHPSPKPGLRPHIASFLINDRHGAGQATAGRS